MASSFVIPESKETGQAGSLGYVNLLNERDIATGVAGPNEGDLAKFWGKNGQFVRYNKYLYSGYAGEWKCLDLSTTYGNVNNPLKKFHELTMYFNKTEAIKLVEEKQKNGKKIVKEVPYSIMPAIITSNLPDNLSYKVGGSWSKPLDWTADAMVDMLLRTASNENASLRTMASTGLMWTNAEPLEITFTIHAFDDTASSSHVNVQECLKILGTYALPDEGASVYRNVPSGVDLGLTIVTNKGERTVFGKDSRTDGSHGNSAKKLDILIGGMLYLESVSLKQFTVNYTNTKNMLLHHWNDNQTRGYGVGQRLLPMTADITITITTVRGLSRLNYNKMLMLNTNADDRKESQTADESIMGTINVSGNETLSGLANNILGI